jgi:hypothetical protein
MIVEGPNGIRIEFPDGTDAETINKVMTEAYQRSQGGQQETQPPSRAGEWSTRKEAMDFVTGGLMTKGGAAFSGLLDAGVGAVQGEGWNYSDNYNKWLDRERQAQADYNNENPVRSAIGKGAGLALGITQLPVWGAGWKGAAGTGALYGSIMGAGQDADSISERATNTATGAATGAGIGGLGYGLGSLIGMGANKASRAWEALNADPQTRAAIELRGLAADAGGPAAVRQSVDDLGPDAVLADVLGERGRAVARQSANISPDARETIEAALLGRKGMQNQRVVSDIEQIAGLPVGNTKNVETLKREAYDAVRPEISAAYTAARKAGAELPFEAFDNIITTPVSAPVWKQALDNVASRAARDPDAGGNLAVLDEMKRLLDGKATQAFRAGDPMASEYQATAKALRDRMDDLLAGDEYAAARGLRQQAYKADEAFDLGDQLGGSRVPLGLPESVAKLDDGLRPNVAQAYAAKKADTLLNRGNTEGAVNEFYTPQGKKAADAALGPGALDKSLAREKAFNQTVKALTGNSTTARQLVEMGLGTGAATALLTGDPMSGGIAGILGALARKGGPAIARKITTNAQQKTAPLIAQALLARDLPAQAASMAPGRLERLSRADRDKLTKMLLLLTEQAQKPQQQPSAGR